MMKKILTISLLIIAVAATVWHRATFAAPMTLSNEPNMFCPHISELTKNQTKGNWTAQTKQGLWKSYGLSFATTITKFVGAQWTGADVGQVTCVYNSEQEFTIQGKTEIQPTLPVLLTFHTLTFQPTEGKWKHAKRGVYNCYSSTQSDCPFKMNIKQSTGNIYEEAESLKENAVNAGSTEAPNN